MINCSRATLMVPFNIIACKALPKLFVCFLSLERQGRAVVPTFDATHVGQGVQRWVTLTHFIVRGAPRATRGRQAQLVFYTW